MDIAMLQISEIQIVRRSPISREMFARSLRTTGPLLVSNEFGRYVANGVVSKRSGFDRYELVPQMLVDYRYSL